MKTYIPTEIAVIVAMPPIGVPPIKVIKQNDRVRRPS
jgi:hypothetical protein